MAQPAALATAGITAGSASLLEQLATSDPQAPVIPGAAPPATVQPNQPDGAPQGIVIGNQTYTQEQIQTALLAQSELAENKQQLEVGKTFYNLLPEHQAFISDIADKLSKGEDPIPKPKRIAAGELAIPENPEIVVPLWSEMTDEARYTLVKINAIRDEILDKMKELSGVVNGMRSYLGQIHIESQDAKTAEALTLKGFKGVTPAVVKEMRESGITDPIKAFAFLKQQSGVPKPPAEDGNPKPPEPGGKPGEAKTFDANDPNLSMGEMIRLMRDGHTPSDPNDVARLNELIKQHG